MKAAAIGNRSRNLPRLAWWLGLLAVGAVATFVEIDRQARHNPAYARLVPPWLASFALAESTSAALRQQRYDVALDDARRLVAIRPVPAENLTLLALAANGEGDTDLAAAAIGEAAMRGWREPVAQVAVLDAAIEQGDWAVATQRLDALRRTGQPLELGGDALRAIGRNSDGRNELARRLAEGAPWSNEFLRLGPDLLEPAAFAQVLDRAETLGARFDCPRLATSSLELLRKGQPLAARAIWQGECARSANHSSSRLSFNPIEDANISPFAWTYPEQAGLFRLVEGEGRSLRLTWSNASVLDRKVAERYFDLAPGSYRISVARPDGAGDAMADGTMRLEVMCFAPSADKPVTHRLPVARDGTISIPATCPVQRIGLLVEGGKGAASRVTVASGSGPVAVN